MSGHRGRTGLSIDRGKPSDSPLFNLFLLFPPFLLFTLSSSIFSVSATAFTELRRGKLETGDQHLSRRRRGSRSNCQTCLFSTHDLFLCVFFQVHGWIHVLWTMCCIMLYKCTIRSGNQLKCHLFFALKALALGHVHQGLEAIQFN